MGSGRCIGFTGKYNQRCLLHSRYCLVFLLIEQVRGRPVSIEIQSMATIAGLVLIGAIFLIVTFQDIANLLG